MPTDGFLFPNDVLEARGLMNRKGFPESYDLTKILNFLADVKSGKEKVEAPVYSHLIYDVLPDQKLSIERPDIVIVEGLNVLQPAKLPKDGEAIPFVSDFFDFSIYIDAADELVESWYVERFLRLRQTAFRDPASYFHRYATLSEEEAVATGLSIWRTINLVNLQREYPADAAARRSHPAQGRGSRGGDGGAQEALNEQPAISAALGRAAASRARYSAAAWCGWRTHRRRRSALVRLVVGIAHFGHRGDVLVVGPQRQAGAQADLLAGLERDGADKGEIVARLGKLGIEVEGTVERESEPS